MNDKIAMLSSEDPASAKERAPQLDVHNPVTLEQKVEWTFELARPTDDRVMRYTIVSKDGSTKLGYLVFTTYTPESADATPGTVLGVDLIDSGSMDFEQGLLTTRDIDCLVGHAASIVKRLDEDVMVELSTFNLTATVVWTGQKTFVGDVSQDNPLAGLTVAFIVD